MPTDPPVKCPKCGELDTQDSRSLLERVYRAGWAGVEWWTCAVCSNTWFVKTSSVF